MGYGIPSSREWYSGSGNHYTGLTKIDQESVKKATKEVARNMLNSVVSDAVTATGVYKTTYAATKNRAKSIKAAASAVIVSHFYSTADNIIKLGNRIFGSSD
ncbi:hypothetical protein AN618_01860 [Fervidicola ferrireducens]|uniref:Uncharacterized protein n=1 Tax=Fervidicola ferrireducens TaxID=520764 RepID=A0A140LE73_9FIRM|nr:hypothetical protein [Fervidicola ferrireducens]KXG78848.1 hypothetical protein AN618_01860 [Fervidicola ferrireducens]